MPRTTNGIVAARPGHQIDGMEELLQAFLGPFVEMLLYGFGRLLLWALGFEATADGQMEEMVGLMLLGLTAAGAAYFLGAFEPTAIGAAATGSDCASGRWN